MSNLEDELEDELEWVDALLYVRRMVLNRLVMTKDRNKAKAWEIALRALTKAFLFSHFGISERSEEGARI